MVKSGKPIYNKLNYIYTISFEKIAIYSRWLNLVNLYIINLTIYIDTISFEKIAIYSRWLNLVNLYIINLTIYIPSALKSTFILCNSLLLYIREVINRKILLVRVLLALFSILFFVFI